MVTKQLFDIGSVNTSATPDVVLAAGSRRSPTFRVIVEVKYKPATERPDRDDLNQVITYGTSYRCPHLVIVQPQSPRPVGPTGLRQLGVIDGRTVWQYVYNLGASHLLEAEAKFAVAVEHLGVLTTSLVELT